MRKSNPLINKVTRIGLVLPQSADLTDKRAKTPMSRDKSYQLTKAKQRDLITQNQQGKALPKKYRFILFGDKRALGFKPKTRSRVLSSGYRNLEQ